MTDSDIYAGYSSMSTDKKMSILRSRARTLAAEPPPPAETGGWIEVVEFQLAYETYAIESKWVREVYPLKELTPVPCTPAFVLGIINVRGQVLPVIDFRRFFDLPLKGLTDLNKVIILKNNEMEIGILADVINGVRTLSSDAIQTGLPTLNDIRAKYLRGVTDDRVVVIDGALFMASNDIVIDDQIQDVG